MFCPICRYEYKQGVTACPDCGAALVAELEPFPLKELHPDEPSQLVTVFETYILPEIVIAKSILEEAGIHFISRDQIAEAAYFQNGPASIMVAYEDAVRAHDLLANLAMDHILDEQMDKTAFNEEEQDSDEKP